MVQPGVALQPLQVSNPSMPGITASSSTMSGVIWSTIRIAACAVERDHDGHARAVERVGQQPQRLRRIVDDEGDVALFWLQ
jgi:hypothetical protein